MKRYSSCALLVIGLAFQVAAADRIVELAGQSVPMADLSKLWMSVRRLDADNQCAAYHQEVAKLIAPVVLAREALFEELVPRVFVAGNKVLAHNLLHCGGSLEAVLAASAGPSVDIGGPTDVPPVESTSGQHEAVSRKLEQRVAQLQEQLERERAEARAEQEVIKSGLVRYELQLTRLKSELAAKDESLKAAKRGILDPADSAAGAKCRQDLEAARGELARALVRADVNLNELVSLRGDLAGCESKMRGLHTERDQCKKDLAAASAVPKSGLAAAFQAPQAAQCEAERARLALEVSALSGRNLELTTKYNDLLERINSPSYV